MSVTAGIKSDTSLRTQILLVDGDARTARVLSRMLREDGFDVEIALDGVAAIGRLSRSPAPDVLVTDLATTHPSGFDVAEYARSRRSDLPVFFVTGHPELARSRDGALLPEPRIFTKPLDYAAFSRELPRRAEAPRASGRSPVAT
jgi:CheY-like chemotaxis protein